MSFEGLTDHFGVETSLSNKRRDQVIMQLLKNQNCLMQQVEEVNNNLIIVNENLRSLVTQPKGKVPSKNN